VSLAFDQDGCEQLWDSQRCVGGVCRRDRSAAYERGQRPSEQGALP